MKPKSGDNEALGHMAHALAQGVTDTTTNLVGDPYWRSVCINCAIALIASIISDIKKQEDRDEALASIGECIGANIDKHIAEHEADALATATLRKAGTKND